MKKHVPILSIATLISIACALGPVTAEAPDDSYTSPRTAWFREAKFGMFIHWGLYAVPAGYWNGKPVPNIGEWILHTAKIPLPEYEPLTQQFNPVKFNAREWARVAKAAGMKYMVITSKHHDGFCMFDTKQVDYNIVKATPFKRDVMKELSDACKREGIKFAFYHSIMDWHHPELQGYWNAGASAAKDSNDPRVVKYVEEQLKPQLKELVTKYDPAILWFDGEWVPWWTQERGREIEKFLWALKPNLIINNRVGKRKIDDGDYETPEQEIPKAALGKRLWETCMTLNDTWGYKKDDQHWKSPDDVIRKLSDIASKGGNFLLNVGPTAEGLIPEPSVKILEEVGKWLKQNGEAVYGTTYANLPQPSWGRITRKDNRLYLIVFNWPKEEEPLYLAMNGKVKSAKVLGGERAKFQAKEAGFLFWPQQKSRSEHAAVLRVDFEGEL